jgi:hypothetical protein
VLDPASDGVVADAQEPGNFGDPVLRHAGSIGLARDEERRGGAASRRTWSSRSQASSVPRRRCGPRSRRRATRSSVASSAQCRFLDNQHPGSCAQGVQHSGEDLVLGRRPT